MSPEFSLPHILQGEELNKVFHEALLRDYPLLYYCHNFTWGNWIDNNNCNMIPTYNYSQEFVKNTEHAIQKYMRNFDQIKHGTDYEKVKHVHDFCVANFHYDYTYHEYLYSILSPLFYNVGVCSGISNFVKLALDYLQVKSFVVHGEVEDKDRKGATENHAWNIVKINDTPYHLDVTWDICKSNEGMSSCLRHDYFNISDSVISYDHIIPNNVPSCLSSSHDYFVMNSLRACNLSELRMIIEKNLNNGITCFQTKLQLKNIRDTEAIKKKADVIATEQYSSKNIHNVDIKPLVIPLNLVPSFKDVKRDYLLFEFKFKQN